VGSSPRPTTAWQQESTRTERRDLRALSIPETAEGDNPGFMKRLIVGLATAVLLWGGVAGTVGPGTAPAKPGPVPLNAWPGCPNDHPAGPCHWCPGDPPVQTGNLRVDPVRWEASICHTYWYVTPGQGNVSRLIWDGDDPPAPPPPPPGLNFCPIPPWCP
jgi:hypothetical protein